MKVSVFKPSSWPAVVTFSVLPTMLIGAIFGMFFLETAARGEVRSGDYLMSDCILNFDCTNRETAPYSLYLGMMFAIAWVLAYVSKYKFPQKVIIVLLGVVIASPFYIFGIHFFPGFEPVGNEGPTLVESILMGSIASFFHIVGLIIAVRLLTSFMFWQKDLGKKKPATRDLGETR